MRSRSFFLRILFFALIAGGCKNTPKQKGFVKIFDGETLEGWDGDRRLWKVENGILVGEISSATPIDHNTFLIWEGGEPSDFELKGEFRISPKGNSGINYRSILVPDLPFALKGYQADIDGNNNYTGQNYEERGRTTLAYRGEVVSIETPTDPSEDNRKNNAWIDRTVMFSLGDPDSLGTLIRKEEWNEIHLVVENNSLKHYVNGVLMSEVLDADTINSRAAGKLGLQLHVGPPMKVEFRDLHLKEL